MRWRKVCVLGIVAALGAAAAWRVVHPPVDTVEEACAVAARWYPADAEKLRVALTNLYAHDGAYGMVSIDCAGYSLRNFSLRVPYTNEPTFVLSEFKYERRLLRLYAQPERRLQAAELLLLGRHTNYCWRVVNKFLRDLTIGMVNWDRYAVGEQPVPPKCLLDAWCLQFAVEVALSLPRDRLHDIGRKYYSTEDMPFLMAVHTQLQTRLRGLGIDADLDSWATTESLYRSEAQMLRRQGRGWWWYLDPRYWLP